jgi:hypothetical protein
VLTRLRLKSFAKVSGSKGIQVYVPLDTTVTYDQTQSFARATAELLEKKHPDKIVADMAKNLRIGKVFYRLEPERRFQNDCWRLLVTRETRPAVRVDAGSMERTREGTQKI